MKAKARTARRIVQARRNAARNATRTHTLASHARLAGLDDSTASSVGGALRAKTKSCGITGETARLFRRNAAGQKLWRQPVKGAKRYSKADVATLVGAYNPRAARLVAAKEALSGYISA